MTPQYCRDCHEEPEMGAVRLCPLHQAAPALLAALQAILDVMRQMTLNGGRITNEAVLAQARATIAAATGPQPMETEEQRIERAR